MIVDPLVSILGLADSGWGRRHDDRLRLLDRIKTLDLMISRQTMPETGRANPVASQLDQLARAFGTR